MTPIETRIDAARPTATNNERRLERAACSGSERFGGRRQRTERAAGPQPALTEHQVADRGESHEQHAPSDKSEHAAEKFRFFECEHLRQGTPFRACLRSSLG